MKVFKIIEEAKPKLLNNEDLSDEAFVEGLESIMDKIMDVIEGKNKKEENNIK